MVTPDELRRVVGRPWRATQTAASRLTFGRGQLDTSRRIELEDFGLAAPGRGEYIPSGWFFARRMFRGCVITPQDVFADLGSGQGRMVCMAARRQPFGRVVGVELVAEFNAVALENVGRMRPKLRCQEIELVTADVVEWAIPDDLTYVYLFNPFGRDILREVLANICRSLDRHPRPLKLIYAHPAYGADVLATGRFAHTRTTRGLRRDIPLYRIDVFTATQ
jgi:SAM-dependent methyltransferase